MKTTNHPVKTSPVTGTSSCHGANHGGGSGLGRRRTLLFVGGAIVAGIAFALNQHWLTVAALVPLLFVLPCAVMMFMCMKGGMNQSQQTNSTESSAPAETQTDTDSRNNSR